MSMMPNSSLPPVGIVILSWNRARDTLACLASLERVDYPARQVIVVDNGSTDGSPALIRQQYPSVVLLASGRNLGFAGGCNLGMAAALRIGVRYVLLLNNDTEVAPDFLGRLVAAAERSPDVGMVGPTIYYHEHPDVIWSAGGMVDRYGTPRHDRVDTPDDGTLPPVREVDYVTGCAILVKRSVIERIGFLDDRFFAYFEETEWCARARRVGFRVLHVPEARVWHKIRRDERGGSPLYLYLMARNRLLYLSCTGASPWILLTAAVDLLRTAASWTIRPRYRHLRPLAPAVLRGVTDFFRGRFGAPSARSLHG